METLRRYLIPASTTWQFKLKLTSVFTKDTSTHFPGSAPEVVHNGVEYMPISNGDEHGETQSLGSFTALLHNSPSHNIACATQSLSASQYYRTASSSSSPLFSSSRHIRLDEQNGSVHRFQPGSTIHFGIDDATFTQAGLTGYVLRTIEKAAIEVAKVINKQHLRITFAYSPSNSVNAFNIQYAPSLRPDILALAFFPGDPRDRWAVRISPRALFHGTGGYLDNIKNIIAHEFMHILGMRHWNAGHAERGEPSFHWPGTRDGDRRSIMNTDPRKLRFYPADFEALRGFYDLASGAHTDGPTIVDIVPAQPLGWWAHV